MKQKRLADSNKSLLYLNSGKRIQSQIVLNWKNENVNNYVSVLYSRVYGFATKWFSVTHIEGRGTDVWPFPPTLRIPL